MSHVLHIAKHIPNCGDGYCFMSVFMYTCIFLVYVLQDEVSLRQSQYGKNLIVTCKENNCISILSFPVYVSKANSAAFFDSWRIS